MRSEEQWTTIGYCEDCGCEVKERDGERKWTGPADCLCYVKKEEDETNRPKP